MNELIEALRREQHRNEDQARARTGEGNVSQASIHLAVADALGNVAAELEDGPAE